MPFGDAIGKPVEKVAEGVTRILLSTGERIQVYLLEMKGGTKIPEHAHVNEQASYIVKGKMETDVSGEKGVLKEGSWVSIPSNGAHSGFVMEDTVMIDIYSPPR